jgi:NitT/TauT family transport system substrate-binding protein
MFLQGGFMKRIRFSVAVTLFVLLAVLTGCRPKAKTGAAKELIDFQLGGAGTNPSYMLGFVAKEEGFFQEEGLNVTISLFSNNQESIAALESGKLDASFLGSVPTIAAIATGHDLSIFGGAMSNGHGLVLKTKFIPPGYKRGDISVLKGRTISTAKYTMWDYELQVILKKNGIEIGEGPDKVNIVYFPGPTAAYNALAGNEIDGNTVAPPHTSIAKADGHTVVYFCNELTNEFPEFENQPCCRQIALTSALAAKPELYIAFDRAIIKAYKFSQENHEKAAEDVSKYILLDKKVVESELFSGYAFTHPDPDKKATTVLKKDVVEFGFTDGVDYDLEKHYNTDIYKKALAQILAGNPNDSVYKTLETRFNSGN